MMHFTINNNGNSRGTFLDVEDKLAKAIAEAEEALKAASNDLLHGRNYQCSETPQVDRNADMQAWQRAWSGLAHVRQFQNDLRARINWHDRDR